VLQYRALSLYKYHTDTVLNMVTFGRIKLRQISLRVRYLVVSLFIRKYTT